MSKSFSLCDGLQQHLQRTIARSRAFYAATEPGHFLVRVNIPAEAPAIPPLYNFDLETQLEQWLDARLAATRPAWQAKVGLDDDSIPSICPQFGIAEHSAWLGMEVLLQESTCLPVPLLKEIEDVDQIKLSEDAPWFQLMKCGYDYLRSRQDGSFLLSVRGTMAPMDLANAVRGDDLFIDFLTEPEAVHRLMQSLTTASQWYFNHLRSWADAVEDGQIYTYNSGWIGPNCIGHLSNDAAMLCGPKVYEEFGLPYEEQQTAPYEKVLYHVHNEKMHYVPQLARLSKLSLLEVAHDPKTPPPIEDLARVLSATGSANLLIHATAQQVYTNIDQLKTRNVMLDVVCCDRNEAEAMIKFVRCHSKSLGTEELYE